MTKEQFKLSLELCSKHELISMVMVHWDTLEESVKKMPVPWQSGD